MVCQLHIRSESLLAIPYGANKMISVNTSDRYTLFHTIVVRQCGVGSDLVADPNARILCGGRFVLSIM